MILPHERTICAPRHNEDLVDLRASELLVGGRAGHHYGEKQNCWTCLSLQAFWLVIEILMHSPGLINLFYPIV